jgi:hypothetical protein
MKNEDTRAPQQPDLATFFEDLFTRFSWDFLPRKIQNLFNNLPRGWYVVHHKKKVVDKICASPLFFQEEGEARAWIAKSGKENLGVLYWRPMPADVTPSHFKRIDS